MLYSHTLVSRTVLDFTYSHHFSHVKYCNFVVQNNYININPNNNYRMGQIFDEVQF